MRFYNILTNLIFGVGLKNKLHYAVMQISLESVMREGVIWKWIIREAIVCI